ncbi:MAG: hypothetical protein ACE5IW_00725 [bacterium]
MVSKLWETEKKRLVEILLRRISHGKEKIRHEEIIDGEYPEVFQVCLKNYARRVFEQEKPLQISTQSHYDLQGEQIKKQLEDLKETLIRETLFTKEEIIHLAKVSVNLQFDALVRPRQTTIEVLFNTTNQRDKDDVLVVVQGLGENRPFIQRLVSAIENLDTETITRQDFEELTRPLEIEVYNEKPISTFLKEINLLIKFEASITGEENRSVNSQVLLGMLNERGLGPIADGMKEEALSKEFWTFKEIENALERHLLVGGLEHLKSPANEEATLHDRKDSKRFLSSRKDAISLDAFDEIDTSLDSEISRKRESTAEPHTIRFQLVEDRAETKPEADSGFTASRRFKESKTISGFEDTLIINRRDIESQPPGPYPALHTLIDQKNRKIFIKKIFRKDGQQYIEFIQRLEKQDKWKEAKAIIDAELEKRGIKPYSKEAILLGDVVFSRYFS